MSKTLNKNHSVTPLMGAAYALPAVPVLLLMSTNNVLSGIYATYHGLALSALATVMLIADFFYV